MKKLLILAVLTFCTLSAFAQKKKRLYDFYPEKEDSAIIKMGYIPVQHLSLLIFKQLGYFKTPAIIDNDSLLTAYDSLTKKNLSSFNIDSFVILQSYFGGDCHARFEHFMYLDTTQKKLVWKVYNIWGGCRAGGGRYFAFKVCKPPKGYTYEIDEVLVERVFYDGKLWNRYDDY